jgi:hypothetical protein
VRTPSPLLTDRAPSFVLIIELKAFTSSDFDPRRYNARPPSIRQFSKKKKSLLSCLGLDPFCFYSLPIVEREKRTGKFDVFCSRDRGVVGNIVYTGSDEEDDILATLKSR